MEARPWKSKWGETEIYRGRTFFQYTPFDDEAFSTIMGSAGGDDGSPGCFADDRLHRSIGQTLQGSFSAVSKSNFATKYAFESSRRDLQNALLCTALKSHFLMLEFCQNFAKIFRNCAKFAEYQNFDKKLRLQSCAKECFL